MNIIGSEEKKKKKIKGVNLAIFINEEESDIFNLKTKNEL